MRAVLTPKWLGSHLFVVTMIVVMVNLGFWQLRRLDERRASNAEIVAASELPAVDLAGFARPLDYAAAQVSGTYRPEHEVLVANRSFEGASGFWIVTPLELDDGRIVAVVRGWVPRLVTAGIDPRPTDPPGGNVTVAGLAFESVRGGRIGAVDEGETPQISRMDIDRYEEVTGLDVIDRWLRLRTQDPAQAGDLPVPVPPPPLDEGPHLSYAVQWFCFSVGTAVVYSLILRRTVRSTSSHKTTDDRSRSGP